MLKYNFIYGFQLYVTNRVIDQNTRKEVWAPIDHNTSDEARKKFRIDPLSELLKMYKEQAQVKTEEENGAQARKLQ